MASDEEPSPDASQAEQPGQEGAEEDHCCYCEQRFGDQDKDSYLMSWPGLTRIHDRKQTSYPVRL